MFDTKSRNLVAKCPHCGDPHRYTELKFPLVNDHGSWLIKCNKCSESFVVDLRNPIESPTGDCNVLERFDDDENPYQGEETYARERAVYQLEINDDKPRFGYDIHPIYCCCEAGVGLELAAVGALSGAFDEIGKQWWLIVNNYLARRLPEVQHLVVSINVPCSCSHKHVATFYCEFVPDNQKPIAVDDMLLADITGVDLEDVLSAIHTKSYLMDALDKLIVRWRLLSDQVLIAAPFVAHQYKTKPERLEIWERLLRQLDPKRTIFLTRSATWSSYKAALLDSGLDHTVLERFGLENRIVAAGNKKQDFHAKVYIGLGAESEVFSGSANLVSGPSMENASFAVCSRDSVERKYLEPLKVSIPSAPARARHHIHISLDKGTWRSSIDDGSTPCLSRLGEHST